MELLAPAGNFSALKAAVICGADAVYLASDKFGARAGAGAFGGGALMQAVEFAHLHGVKVYLTVNTLIKDSEINQALSLIRQGMLAGVDAFIVQDLGLIACVRKEFPDAVLHASTQMGICNDYGARFAKSLGIKRVVVARETLATDIKKIKDVGVDVEFFCQGALCVAYSGNCYYSSLVSGCSGNRGRCLQLCRKKYNIDEKIGYFLSAKDICLLDKIQQLKEMGVDSLKIEGRLRSPEYVAETVAVYRSAIDGKPAPDGLKRLKKVFNRGNYCSAYLQNPTEDVVFPKTQNNIGYKCGTVVGLKGKKAKLSLHDSLEVGDGVKYMRDGFEVGGGFITSDKETSYDGNLKVGDDVCITKQASLSEHVAALDGRLHTRAKIVLNTGETGLLELHHDTMSVIVQGKSVVLPAKNKPLTSDDVRNAVGQLGGTDFVLDDLEVTADKDIFYPVSHIKEMRKAAVSALREKILSEYTAAKSTKFFEPKINHYELSGKRVFVQVGNIETLDKVAFGYTDVILNPADYDNFSAVKSACERLNGKVFLNLPIIMRGEDCEVIRQYCDLEISGYVANNVSHYVMFEGKPIIGGIGLNFLNRQFGGVNIASVESDEYISGAIEYAYGKPPLMHFTHCPRKIRGGICKDCRGYEMLVRDEKGAEYTMRRLKEKYCYGILVPNVPINNISGCRNGMLIDLTYATDDEIDELNSQLRDGKIYTKQFTRANHGRILQ